MVNSIEAEIEKWSSEFAKPLIKDPEIRRLPEMIEDIKSIAKQLYFTREGDDAGYVPNFLGLSRLAKYCNPQTEHLVKKCLDTFSKHRAASWVVQTYVQEFKTNQEFAA